MIGARAARRGALLMTAGVAATIFAVSGGGGGTGCTTTVSSSAAIVSAAAAAAPGDVVCVADGTYTGPTVTARKTADITIQPVTPGRVTFTTGFELYNGARHIVIKNMVLQGGISVSALSGTAPSDITISHNDITSPVTDSYALILDSFDCVIQGCDGTSSVPWIANVTIIGNRFHDVGLNNNHSQDALQIKHSQNVEVAYNEFTNNIFDPSFVWNGSLGGVHTDNIQTVSGFNGLNIHHNYFHDNNTQDIFVKDGHGDNLTVSDNLVLRNQCCTSGQQATLNLYDVTGATIDNNTFWGGGGVVFQGTAPPATGSLTDNVIANDGGAESGWTISPVSNNTVGGSPSFTNTAVDDYRLSPNPSGQGVDWRPSDFVYGPAG